MPKVCSGHAKPEQNRIGREIDSEDTEYAKRSAFGDSTLNEKLSVRFGNFGAGWLVRDQSRQCCPPNQIATECLFRVSSTTMLWFFLLLRAPIWIKTYPKARILQPFDVSKTHNHSSPNCGKVTGLILAWSAEKANQVLARTRPTIPHSDSPVKSLNASAQVSAMDFLPTSMSSASNRPKATIFL